jgi:uracil-DNA glycosylase family 4
VTEAERRVALEAIATEVRDCKRCRLHEGRTKAVPGEGHPSTEVVFVGEGPGFNEDRQGRPFVGRAGDLLVRHLGSVGWRRDEVFITNIVKCRPPENRDPEPDEVAACAPYLKRQLEVLDPALIVTLGRHSMGRFMPGARISQAHGTVRPVDPETGVSDAMVFAMYHPAAALRSTEVERQSYEDVGRVPDALQAARRRRSERRAASDEERRVASAEEPQAASAEERRATPDEDRQAALVDPAAPISPPLLSNAETFVVAAAAAQIDRPSAQIAEGDAPIELVETAIAVAAVRGAAESVPANHPGDIRAAGPPAPAEAPAPAGPPAPEVSRPEVPAPEISAPETTDPSDQLPLF